MEIGNDYDKHRDTNKKIVSTLNRLGIQPRTEEMKTGVQAIRPHMLSKCIVMFLNTITKSVNNIVESVLVGFVAKISEECNQEYFINCRYNRCC